MTTELTATPPDTVKKAPQWKQILGADVPDQIKRLSLVSTGAFLLSEVWCTDLGLRLPVKSWKIEACTDNVLRRDDPDAAFPKITVEIVMAVLESDDDNPEEMPELQTVTITRPMYHVLLSTMSSPFKFKKSYDTVFNFLWSKLNAWPNFYMSPSQIKEAMAISAQLDKVLPADAANVELAAAEDEEVENG